jgi:branched-chain amino acid transport system substrate-binding protein
MKKRYMLVGLLILLLVVALMAIACGEEEEATTTTTAAPTETTAAPTETTAAPTGTTAAPSTDTTAAAGPATGEPILVGFSNSLTGAAAAPGQSVQNGVDLQVEIINNSGGVNGRPIKIVGADDKSDVTNIVANMTKMAEQDKVDAFVGPFVVFGCEAARALAEQAQIPLVAEGPGSVEMITDPAKQMKWSVAFTASAPPQADAIMKIIAKNGWKNIIGMHDILQIHAETLALVKEGAEAGGYQMTVLPDTVGIMEADYSPFINKLKAEYDEIKPDAILLYVNNFAAAPIYKGLRALGVDVPMLSSPAAAHPTLFALGPEAVEGFMVLDVAGLANPAAMPDSPLKEMQLGFVDAYTAKYDTPPDFLSFDGASMLMTLAEAMKQAGGPDDKAKVAEALINMSGFQTYEGIVQYSPTDTGQGIDSGIVQWTVKGGQFTDPQQIN